MRIPATRFCRYLTLFLCAGGISMWHVIPVLGQGTPFQISRTGGEIFSGSVAFDGINYFVVWHDQLGRARTYGVRVSPKGEVLDPEGLLISDRGGHGRKPSVVFNGENYFVVWLGLIGPLDGAIYGARVDVKGKVLDPSGIRLIPPAPLWQFGGPSVAFNGTHYLVTWDQAGCTPAGGIFGIRVDPDGMVVDKSRIVISHGGSNTCPQVTSVASSETDFLVTWDAIEGNNRHVRGSRINDSGEVLDPSGLNVASASGDQRQTAVSFDGSNYFVVWTDTRNGLTSGHDIYGARVTPSGRILDPDGIPVVTAPGSQDIASVAFNGVNHLVVWEDLRNPGPNQVWGAEVSPEGRVLQLDGFRIFAGSSAATPRHVMFGDTTGLIIWDLCRSESCSSSDLYGLILE